MITRIPAITAIREEIRAVTQATIYDITAFSYLVTLPEYQERE
jgi:hypothetical protein